MAGLRNLEKGPKLVTPQTLRSFRTLLTPAARAAMVPVLTAPKRPQLQETEAAIARAAKSMWIDFHWCADNPFLSEEIGVCGHV